MFPARTWVLNIRSVPPGSPSRTLVRLRMSRGSELVQVSQPQPTSGTPTLVPVPRNSSRPERSLPGCQGGRVP